MFLADYCHNKVKIFTVIFLFYSIGTFLLVYCGYSPSQYIHESTRTNLQCPNSRKYFFKELTSSSLINGEL